MVMALYIKMKKQPNYKICWMKDCFFHCTKIVSIFSRVHFIELRRCLHLTNSKYEGSIEKEAPNYNNIHQTRWFLNESQHQQKFAWHLGKTCTIDEMMIH